MRNSGTKGQVRHPANVILATLATLLPSITGILASTRMANTLTGGGFNIWLGVYTVAMLCAYLLLARMLYSNRSIGEPGQPNKRYTQGFAILLAVGLAAALVLSLLFGLISMGITAAFGGMLSYGALVLVINLLTGLVSLAVAPVFLHVFLSFGLTNQTLQQAIQTAFPPKNKHYGFVAVLLLVSYGLGQAVFYIFPLLPGGVVQTVFSIALTTAIGTAVICMLVHRYAKGRG